MDLKKKINLLMISSSSSLGGGTKHMFMLGENLSSDYKIFYAIPNNKNFHKYLTQENHLAIAERKLEIRDIKNLRRFIRSNSIDIIHAHGKGAGVIARIACVFSKKPLIYTFHGIHLRCHNRLKNFIYIAYEYLFGWIDSNKILVSKSEKLYAKRSNIFLGNNSIVINNGVNEMPIKDSENKKDFTNNVYNFSKINVISICRFVVQKNIQDILEIACLLSDINFYIVGNGPLFREINNLIFKKDLKNVFLLGEKNDIFNYLYSSDIYLSTSLYEGLPLSILEAMSIGIPIVASNVRGNCDTIVNNKSGFLYEINNLNDAAYYIEKLAKNKKLREKIGNSAFYRQRRIFSKAKMIRSYDYLYLQNFLKK